MLNLYFFECVELDHGNTAYLPFSTGSLWAYLTLNSTITDNYTLQRIFVLKDPHDKVLEELEALPTPDVIGFSSYIWNKTWAKQMAALIKQRYPNCLIVFGGPDVSVEYSELDYVDVAVIGEGEQALEQILTKRLNNEHIDRVVKTPRLTDLTNIPSPYTMGIFDDIIKRYPNFHWRTTFETNRGCPYTCTFCTWGSGAIGTKIKAFSDERVKNDIEWIIGKPIVTMMCADANFGIMKERDMRTAKLLKEIADRDDTYIAGVYFSWAKNSTESTMEIAKVMFPYVGDFTLSNQSLNPDTLEAIKRTNASKELVEVKHEAARKLGIRTYTEFIVGLPLETLETFKKGIASVLELNNSGNIIIHLAMLFPNAELSQPDYVKKYGIKTVEYKAYDDTRIMINETNTMTTEDIANAMMFGSLVVSVHVTGISRILAKYCHDLYNISYLEFYNRLEQKIVSSDLEIGEVYRSGYDKRMRFLKEGIYEGGFLTSTDFPVLLGRRIDDILVLAFEMMEEWNIPLSTDHKIFFENQLYNPSYQYPIECSIDVDVTGETFVSSPTTYIIKPTTFDVRTDVDVAAFVMSSYMGRDKYMNEILPL